MRLFILSAALAIMTAGTIPTPTTIAPTPSAPAAKPKPAKCGPFTMIETCEELLEP